MLSKTLRHEIDPIDLLEVVVVVVAFRFIYRGTGLSTIEHDPRHLK